MHARGEADRPTDETDYHEWKLSLHVESKFISNTNSTVVGRWCCCCWNFHHSLALFRPPRSPSPLSLFRTRRYWRGIFSRRRPNYDDDARSSLGVLHPEKICYCYYYYYYWWCCYCCCAIPSSMHTHTVLCWTQSLFYSLFHLSLILSFFAHYTFNSVWAQGSTPPRPARLPNRLQVSFSTVVAAAAHLG